MAKGNFIVGKIIGSVGDVTAYSRGNDQIVRRRNRYVKNPRTQAQTINRIIAATIGSAYSRLSAIADHSFQGHSTKADNMARFLKANQGLLRSTLANGQDAFGISTFQAIGRKGIVANPYIISEGTLPRIQVVLGAGGRETDVPCLLHGGGAGVTVTYQSICDALHLQRGDQLSFLFILSGDKVEVPELSDKWGGAQYLSYCRVILDPTNQDGTAAPMSTPLFTEQLGINLPNPRNENTAAFHFGFAQSYVYFEPADYDPDNSMVVAATVIASRKEGSTWLRSSQQFVVVEAWEDAPTLQQAIDASYPSTGAIADPSKFLNAALQG